MSKSIITSDGGTVVITPGGGTTGRRIPPFAAALALLAGCTPAQQTVATLGLEAAGVPAPAATTISTTAGAAGQLLCNDAGQWKAVAGANVLNAAADKVATVCSDVAAGAVPGMPQTPTTAVVVNVADAVIAALNASKVAPAT